MPTGSLSCWILTDGTVGMEVQCTGLAKAAGLDPIVKRIVPHGLLRAAPTLARLPGVPLAHGGDALAPPWPDVLISCGRRIAGAAIGIRARARGQTFAVHIQDPRVSPTLVDLLVVPAHDPARGDNVVVTLGALNRLAPDALAAEADRVRPSVAHLPRPWVAVNVGGANKRYDFGVAAVRSFAHELVDLAERHGCGLMVACSRRTDAGTKAILATTLSGIDAPVWIGDGANPYLGYLALADHIIVTSDSVNMVSEACTTGKPVHVVEIEPESGRLAAFHEMLEERGATRRFDGSLDGWTYEPLDETARVAGIVRRHLAARGLIANPGDAA